MKLWLVRHAQPLAAAGVCYGAMDVPADEQATAAAVQALADVLPPGLPVRTSPLRRCVQLAQALGELRPGPAARADPRLAEMDFGRWEGQPWQSLGRTEIDRWMADFAHHRCGGGDSVASFMARVQGAVEEVRAAGADTVWVTHAGVVRAVRLLALGVAVPRHAGEWPVDGPGFGQWECIDLLR
ncbi:histidine phosphatase family protein [Ramlibacter sp.]|uniref:histidine phosphatase family protein n=1 Tax=Ramlibacter sp. TaxID=1917967 RepID=UPI002FC9D645